MIGAYGVSKRTRWQLEGKTAAQVISIVAQKCLSYAANAANGLMRASTGRIADSVT